MPIFRYRLEASVNPKEYEEILEYCKKNDISIYKLVKKSVFEYIERERKKKNKGGGNSNVP